MTEDWKTYKKPQVEIKKELPDEIHEFLTKVYNVYFVQLPPNLYKHFDVIRDKLIPLTVRFDQSKYQDFCHAFSIAYRSVMIDKNIAEDVKKLIRELADKTNEFFISKGLPKCVEELKYYNVKVRVRYRGKPLPKATVVAEAEGKTAASTLTNEEGEAVFEVPNGKYTIYVYKHLEEDTYVYEEKPVEVNKDTDIEFDIETTKSSSEISRERGGRPLIKEVS